MNNKWIIVSTIIVILAVISIYANISIANAPSPYNDQTVSYHRAMTNAVDQRIIDIGGNNTSIRINSVDFNIYGYPGGNVFWTGDYKVTYNDTIGNHTVMAYLVYQIGWDNREDTPDIESFIVDGVSK